MSVGSTELIKEPLSVGSTELIKERLSVGSTELIEERRRRLCRRPERGH
jgi:hypothetical protein